MLKGVLTMSDFPVLSLRGSTDAERLAELASYIPSLTSAIEREMMSLDFSNLNEGLQQRINNSITEHQDLSGFASKNYAKNHFYEKKEVDDRLKPIKTDVSTHAGKIDSLERYVFGDTGTNLQSVLSSIQTEITAIKKRLDRLE